MLTIDFQCSSIPLFLQQANFSPDLNGNHLPDSRVLLSGRVAGKFVKKDKSR